MDTAIMIVTQSVVDSTALPQPKDAATADAPPPTCDLEIIGGFTVHPLASRFPLLTGQQFDDLVEAIRRSDVVAPVELHGGQLIDGRNRVRAVEELRRRGFEVALPTTEWQPQGNETVAEHIFNVNLHRRHLTDDQRAVLATEFFAVIQQERQNRQAATRFGAAGRTAVALNSAPPCDPAEKQPRTSQEKFAASSVGQLATLGGVTRHKATQAIALCKGRQTGTVSEADFDAVRQGVKPLRQVAQICNRSKCSRAATKETPLPSVDLLFEGAEENDTEDRVDAPDVTEDEIRRRWERFKLPFAVADHGEVRRQLARIIADEQTRFDKRK